MTSFANGKMVNYTIFGEGLTVQAYNVCYDNSLNCLMFYADGNKLYYNYGDPRTSQFSSLKQTYTLAGPAYIQHSLMRYCPVANAFYIVLLTDEGLYFLKYNGTFTSLKISDYSMDQIQLYDFNFDTEGNILVGFTNYISAAQTINVFPNAVYIDKNLQSTYSKHIAPKDNLSPLYVFQVNSSGNFYWALLGEKSIYFFNKEITAVDATYKLVNPNENNNFASRKLGEIIGFHKGDNDEGNLGTYVSYYDLSNPTSTSIEPSQQLFINDFIPTNTHSAISIKDSNLFFILEGKQTYVASNYFLDKNSYQPVAQGNFLIPGCLQPQAANLYCAGYNFPMFDSRIIYILYNSEGYYNLVNTGSISEFRRFCPVKYQRGF